MISEKLAKSIEGNTFPFKLFILAHSSEISSIQWSKSGNSVLVDKINIKECFAPKIFNVKNIWHLYRQFGNYNFKKIHRTSMYWIFQHEFFKAGRIDLLPRVKSQRGERSRRKAKRTAIFSNDASETIRLAELEYYKHKNQRYLPTILKKRKTSSTPILKKMKTLSSTPILKKMKIKRQTTSQKINNLKTQYLQEQHVNKSATSPIHTSVGSVEISESFSDRFYSDETSEFSKELSSELYQNINHLESMQDINFNNTSFLWNPNFEDLISESLPESSTGFTAANQSELTNHVLTHPNQINPSCVATSPIDTSVDNVKISENLTDRFYSDETSEFSKELSSELYQNINHLESMQDINFNNTSFLWNPNFEDLISESLPESSTGFTAANQSELTNHVLTHPNQINPSCVSKEYDSFTSDSLNTIEEWNQSDWDELNQFLERELLNSYSYDK